MPSNQPKTVDAEPAPDAPTAVNWTPPVDPGDAGGMGNSTERAIVPGTLHETAEDVKARGGMWGRG
ncbi:hypothetical protein FV225_00955 [Methylobacterium sp. WL93]|uniref:hypothetical protein n=1 Tax=Methylobacterium sp. WL93 TaxID=2603892 RepID=UPI0011C74022|nr:hypothetical protein [Methylobacterium sp. WL93]TXN41802.1 hypothetical protein FV225_00955 [Methylobacterium sp. WL93]